MKIAVVGAGPIGRAIEKLAREAGHSVAICEKDPSRADICVPLRLALPNAAFAFLCVPGDAVRSAATEIVPHLGADTAVVSLSKGMESATAKFMPEVLAEALPQGARTAMLCGPMLAGELMEDRVGGAAIASADAEVCGRLKEAFRAAPLRLTCTDDVMGTAVSAVVKNVYALGIGIAAGLSFGKNETGILICEALQEAGVIIERFGGRHETFEGFAGIGDLVATGLSERSRNRIAGMQLARTGKYTMANEGGASLGALVQRLGDISDLPFLTRISQVVLERRDPYRTFTLHQRD